MDGLFRLHTDACVEKYGRYNRDGKDCRCMVHFEGKVGQEFIRQSTKTRTWSKAVALVKLAKDRGYWDKPAVEQPKSDKPSIQAIADAFMDSLENRKGRGILRSSTGNYKTLLKRLVAYCEKHGYASLDELSLTVLDEFRDTWPIHSIIAIRLATRRLKAFYSFALKRGWCKTNTAAELHMPNEENVERMPFSPEEERAIFATATGEIQTFCYLMRYSGMAICDAALLQTSELKGDEIRYYRKKTRRSTKRVFVVVPIPAWLVERIKQLPLHQGRYYFCHGNDGLGAATHYWYDRLNPMFKDAGIEKGESHRFRHTFATRLLEEGESLEDVSRWLGHSSIKTTERYYSHWLEGRIKKSSDRLRLRYSAATEALV